jgi:threonine dehydrogenase-like Zn-dependent dehydrogenase
LGAFPTTSLALVQRGTRDVELIELPVPPQLRDDEALVRVEGSGICGTDYEQYTGHLEDAGLVTYPLVIGHEPVVRIEAIGPRAQRLWGVGPGDRVAVEPHSGCGVCRHCTSGRQVMCANKLMYGYMPLELEHGLWGSLAQYMVLRGNTVLHRIPDTMSIEDALLFNPLGAGFEWAADLGGVTIGQDVLIIGAGQRGLACVVASVMAGAHRIVVSGLDRDKTKLEMATALGATDIVVTDPDDADSLIDAVGEKAFDCVIDVTPRALQPVVDAVHAARSGGTVVIAGIKGGRAVPGFITDELLFKSLTLKGALGVRSHSYRRAVEVLVEGKFDFSAWHTHTLSLTDGESALQLLGGEDDSGGAPIHITVTPPG